MIETYQKLWEALLAHLTRTPQALNYPSWVLFLLAGMGLAAVLLPLLWTFSSYLVTLVHEAGHAVAAMMVGSKVTGITIRSDRSGETTQVGSSFLPFRLWVTWWGYPFPSVLGALYLWASYEGWQGIAITITLVICIIFIIQIRSFYAFLAIGFTTLTTWALWWYFPPEWTTLVLYSLGWFLLFGGVKSLINLTQHHLRGDTSHSDAEALWDMVFIPAPFWLLTFWGASLASIWWVGQTFLAHLSLS